VDASLRAHAERALAEDLGTGDITAEAIVPPEARATARIVQKQAGVVFGLDVVEEVFRQVGADDLERLEAEGEWRDAVPVDVATVSGDARALLAGERTALNFLCHLSGVATHTARFVAAVAATNPSTRIWDTRKTLPGLRALEKAAVRAGGGVNHRGSLSDFVLVKDNHLAGVSIADAVARAKARWPGRAVEVECDRRQQVVEAIDAGATLVLCDNMTPAEVAECVTLAGGRVLVEVSGGVTIDTVAGYAAAGADLISTSVITQSAPALDIGLDLEG
jgi:nicotinate-nucleotide pyrophosphorylase (carboxylating)